MTQLINMTVTEFSKLSFNFCDNIRVFCYNIWKSYCCMYYKYFCHLHDGVKAKIAFDFSVIKYLFVFLF